MRRFMFALKKAKKKKKKSLHKTGSKQHTQQACICIHIEREETSKKSYVEQLQHFAPDKYAKASNRINRKKKTISLFT